MNATVSAGDTLAPQSVTNVINVNDVANGSANMTRSTAPPLYAMLSFKSSDASFRSPPSALTPSRIFPTGSFTRSDRLIARVVAVASGCDDDVVRSHSHGVGLRVLTICS